MNEVDAQLQCMAAAIVAQVVAKLILLLVAFRGEKSDGRCELIVAEGLKA